MSKFTDFLNSAREKDSGETTAFQKFGKVISMICRWLYKLRKIFMAVPVLIAALKLAADNASRLPETVGLNMQSNGEYAISVTRNYAVMGPLFVTLFCLLLMFCSRKAAYPWIISIFSLVLPLLIYVINVYPG